MKTLSVELIHPKASKLFKELEALGLIKVTHSKNIKSEDFYISERMIQILDNEYEDYKNGIGKNYTKEEVFSKFK